MKNTKIVLVAEWDGWCGACGADRPLVLTRTGRQRLRTWLTAAADDSRPLVLTCRLCGTGVDVPLERDDPPVLIPAEARERPAARADVGDQTPSEQADATATVPVPAVACAELTAGRQAAAAAFGALLAQRSAAEPEPVPVPAIAPAVPLQRTASSVGLAELQLLGDGIDLLGAGRS